MRADFPISFPSSSLLLSLLNVCSVCVLLQASTSALMEIPAVNAVIDDNTNEIVYRNFVDISVAVASPNGLVVPVLRNTERMNFAVRDIVDCLILFYFTQRVVCE